VIYLYYAIVFQLVKYFKTYSKDMLVLLNNINNTDFKILSHSFATAGLFPSMTLHLVFNIQHIPNLNTVSYVLFEPYPSLIFCVEF